MADGAVPTPAACDVVRVWPRAEPAAFTEGLAKLAKAAVIVACHGAGGPRGLLATSLSTLSTQPPRLLVCVDKSAAAHSALIAADSLSLSLLADDQGELAAAFPAETDGEFDPQSWRLEPPTPPQLRDALAAFAGPIRCRIDAGAATIFIIDISTARSRDGAALIELGGALKAVG